MELYEVLNNRRKELKMKYDKLHELSGVPESSLKKICTGVTKDPQISTLKAIAQALDYTLDDLYRLASPGTEKRIKPEEEISSEALQFALDFDRLSDDRKRLARGFMALLKEHVES